MLDIKNLLRKILNMVRMLPNYNDPDHADSSTGSNRPTTLKISSDNTGSVRQYLHTGAISDGTNTAIGDGNVLHFNWDNSNLYASQLHIGHNARGEALAHRVQTSAGWTPWTIIAYEPYALPANTNLNNATILGDYYCTQDATVQTFTNCPTTRAFTMTIRDGLSFNNGNLTGHDLYRVQTIIDRWGEKYVRYFASNDYGSTWTFGDGGWVKEGETRYTRTNKYTSGSATVNKAQDYNLCSLSFPAYSGTWLILSNVYSNSGNNFVMRNSMSVTSGTAALYRNHDTRVTTGSGQGLANWAFLSVGTSAVTVTLKCYGYNTTSHTETGLMCAIKL